MNYYIQDKSFAGRTALWWKGSTGYTMSIAEAGLYTREDVKKIYQTRWSARAYHKDIIQKLTADKICAGLLPVSESGLQDPKTKKGAEYGTT